VILNRFATDLRVLLRATGFGITREHNKRSGFNNRLLLFGRPVGLNVRRYAGVLAGNHFGVDH
jgi:hypothetical protein